MTPSDLPDCEDEFSSALAEYDEALMAGRELPVSTVRSPELLDRVMRGLQCLLRLHQERDVGRSDKVPLANWRHFGRFELHHELGHGAFGVVFLAYDAALKREVALKLPRIDALIEPELRRRFEREAQAAARLDHPHIVPVYEAGAIGDLRYIAYAYCPSVTLAQWLRAQDAPLPSRDVATFLSQVSGGVAYAHEQGVLHRDLKPSNILLTVFQTPLPDATAHAPSLMADSMFGRPLNSFVPKISDFGLARLTGMETATHLAAADLTLSGMFVGTPGYMAPEQAGCHGGQIGPAADVYALGAVLYEMLTGRPPFRGETPLDTLQQVRAHEVVPPRRLQPSIPRDLETICLRCLEKDPRRRYQSASALTDDLNRYLQRRPIQARPVGVTERLWKWSRRQPVIALLLATILMMSVGGFVAVTLLWRGAVAAIADKQSAWREEARQRLQTEKQLAEKLTALADLAWQSVRVEEALQYLGEVPEVRRGSRWEYLWRSCHAQRFSWTVDSSPVAVEISPDGNLVAATTEIGTVHLWDSRTGQALAPFQLQGRGGAGSNLRFRAKGRELVRAATFSSSPKTGVPDTLEWCVWDTATGEPAAERRSAKGAVTLPRLSRDGNRVAAHLRSEKKIVVWDVASAKRLCELPQPQSCWDHVFTPDGDQVLAAATDGMIRIWDVETGELRGELSCGTVTHSPLALDDTGKTLLFAARRNLDLERCELHLWDLPGQEIRRAFPAHDMRVYAVALTPQGDVAASGGDDRAVILWDCLAGTEILTLRGHTGRVTAIAFSPAGSTLASCGTDRTVRLWESGGKPYPGRLK